MFFEKALSVLLFVVVMVTLSFPWRAEGEEGPETFSIDRAVALALSRAPEIQAARETEALTESRVEQTRSAYYPRLTAEGSYGFHYPKNELPLNLPPQFGNIAIGEIDDYHRVRAGAQVGFRLLDVSRSSRVQATKQSLEAEKAKTLETTAGLAFLVRATFLTALFARDAKTISEESLKVARAEERRADLKTKIGTGSQVALAQNRVRVAGLQAQQRQAANELDRQLAILGNLLGLEKSPTIEGDLTTLAGIGGAYSLDSSPAISRIRSTRQAAELNAKSISQTFIPTVSLTGRVDYEYPHAMKTEWGPLYQAGVTINWDLFDGGLRQHSVKEAEAQKRSIEKMEQSTLEQLRRKLIEVEAKERSAHADFLSAQETLQQSEIYLRAARAALEAGTGTSLDVNTAELGIDRARIAIKSALLSKALAKAERLQTYGIAVEKNGGAK